MIVAVAPNLAGRIDYEPALPARRDLLTQQLPHGQVIKVMVAYDEPWWRSEGLNGQAASADGPVGVVFDNTVPGPRPGDPRRLLRGEPTPSTGARRTPPPAARPSSTAWSATSARRRPSPIDYVERDWAAEAWTRGCYGAHFPTGAWTRFGPALREPCGPIHWAGTETATRWMGYIDGAVQSGERAASEVLTALT